MRLFVGIELPDRIRRAAGETIEEMRSILPPSIGRGLRWVAADKLHVTVWFIGDVDDARAGEVSGVLAPPLMLSPFSTRLGEAGTFPAAGAPRVLWVGIQSGAERLREVHRQVGQRLARCGIAAEPRPYSPHITIARVKDISRRDVPALRAALASLRIDPGEWEVDAATLFRSRLSPPGSPYEPLLRVPLT